MPVPPFVGRARELAVLQREWDVLGRGPGRMVLVSADPGMGKTRLLREFADRVRPHALVLTGHGSPLTESVPLGIVAELLEARLPDLAGDLTPDADSPWRSFAELRRRLADVAADRPLVLLLDDVHQADRLSWDLLAYLGRFPPTAPVLVVAATRVAPLTQSPGLAETLGALGKDGIVSEVRLRSFGPAEIMALASVVLGREHTDDELVTWLNTRAGGNPLFTTAVLEQLAEGAARSDVPASVRERVAQMRAGLPPTARQVLDLAAVLGHSFAAATIATLTEPGASAILDRLVSERLLVEGSDGYDFAHPLLREAVYETVGPARRRELHEHVGRRLVTAPLAVRAFHVGLGALPGDTGAIEVLRAAARDAVRLQSPRAALRHLSCALSLAPVPDRELRKELLDEIAEQASAVADHLTGISALTELIALAQDDPVGRARAHMRLASFLSTGAADVAAAELAATEAIVLFGQSEANADLAAALNERAWIRGMAGDFSGQLDGCHEALRVAEADSACDTSVLLHIIGPLGAVLAMRGDFDEAKKVHARAVRLAAATNDPRQIAWNAAVVHLTEAFEGNFAAAARAVDPIVDPAPKDADIATPWRTLTDWFLGRWQLGRDDCAVVREMFPVGPSAHMAWTFSMAALLEEAIAEPGVATTEAWVGQAGRAYGERDLYFFTALHRWALGTLAWLRGDLGGAATYLQRSHEWLRTTGTIGFEGLLLAELPEVLVALGEVSEVRRLSERAAEINGRLGTRFSAAQAAYVAGLTALAEGDKSAAVDALSVAASGYAGVGTPFLEARAREHLAGIVPAQRLAHLSAAGRLYGALPARRHHDRVMALLRAEGPAGKRAAQQVGALTPRERQIAVLAARGLASHDIAAKLHLSTRTVETHLGRAYHKLGIEGRQGLAAALDATAN